MQTVAQRGRLLRELLPQTHAIGEICCGDCAAQWQQYRQVLPGVQYTGLDIHPAIVAANRARGIPCVQGDALDGEAIRPFLACDILFFGPPLSVDCDGHTLLDFHAVTPGFAPFARLLLADLHYQGTLVCIAPRGTNLGDARQLYEQIRSWRDDVGLHLIHYSYATITGDGQATEPRLKYVELWFSSQLDDSWRVYHDGLAAHEA
ncbi:MAG: hypothetical protein R3E31_14780 [Chloroflexota bacterium]|nr:hypothetical protein [Ardenticatenaceae bacterium]